MSSEAVNMHFGTIASGSSGNCLFAGNRDTQIIIDAGISCKRIATGIKQFGGDPAALKGLLITHEHSDHINGIGVFLRKYKIPVYATEKTLYAILDKTSGEIDTDLFYVIDPDRPFKLGSIEICPFRISHDAADPVSYTLTDDDTKIGTATDLGVYTDYTVDHLKDSDILYIEANHDIAMLQVGSYPYHLKQRILSDRGHLCNEVSGRLIGRLLNDKTKNVVLGHLSQENNFPQLALKTVELEAGRKADLKNMNISITVAPRTEASDLFNKAE